jgi:phage shock protein PspC (stress-responsive transcriptional regulator)
MAFALVRPAWAGGHWEVGGAVPRQKPRQKEWTLMEARPGLMRSRDDRIIAGVCGGIAEWLGWSSTTVRILFVLISVLSAAFPGILIYVLLWLFMPEREE